MTIKATPPEIGSEIYVPTRLYLSRGREDVCGGKATVSRIETSWTITWVYVEGIDRGYNWDIIGPAQEKHMRDYAGRVAHRCPDNAPEANTGAL